MKKRNPPRISLMNTLTVNIEKFRNVPERLRGGRRGREVSRQNQEKKLFIIIRYYSFVSLQVIEGDLFEALLACAGAGSLRKCELAASDKYACGVVLASGAMFFLASVPACG